MMEWTTESSRGSSTYRFQSGKKVVKTVCLSYNHSGRGVCVGRRLALLFLERFHIWPTYTCLIRFILVQNLTFPRRLWTISAEELRVICRGVGQDG